MKPVLMIAYHVPPEGGSSGVLRTLKFSKYLPDEGYRPHILTVREGLYRSRDESLRKDIPHEAVLHRTFALDTSHHLALWGRYPGFLAIPDRMVSWLPFGVWAGLRALRRHGIRVIYSTSPLPTAHLIAAWLRRLTGIAWVADFRDPWIEEGIHPPPGSFRERVERPLERWVLRSADRIVTTTPRLREELLRRHPGLDEKRVRVIYNGFDEDDFLVPTTRPARDRFEILHAGLVTPEFRDPFPLLRAIASLIGGGSLPRDRVRVTFLGGGDYPESEPFRRQVESLGLSGQVEIAGRIPHNEALTRQQRAAVLLLLQASDDTRTLIPAKAFEYLRLGRPILTLTLDGDTADLMRGMPGCRVLDPADAPALHGAVLGLFAEWEEKQGCVSVARSLTRFERRRLTAELAGVFHELD